MDLINHNGVLEERNYNAIISFNLVVVTKQKAEHLLSLDQTTAASNFFEVTEIISGDESILGFGDATNKRNIGYLQLNAFSEDHPSSRGGALLLSKELLIEEVLHTAIGLNYNRGLDDPSSHSLRYYSIASPYSEKGILVPYAGVCDGMVNGRVNFIGQDMRALMRSGGLNLRDLEGLSHPTILGCKSTRLVKPEDVPKDYEGN
jgi:hypothetical protein